MGNEEIRVPLIDQGMVDFSNPEKINRQARRMKLIREGMANPVERLTPKHLNEEEIEEEAGKLLGVFENFPAFEENFEKTM